MAPRMSLLSFLVATLLGSILHASQEPPTEWVDHATGHRIIQLSREPGSASLYFHQNAYTADGDKLLITTPAGLSTIHLKTREIEHIVDAPAGQPVVGKRSRKVYYLRGNAVLATNLDTKATRKIGTLPFRSSAGLTVNADETLLAGSCYAAAEGNPTTRPGYVAPVNVPNDLQAQTRPTLARSKGQMMEIRFAQKIPMALYTIDIRTGQVRTFNHCTDWLNHVQFSPTDPTLLMFAHEGPWHKVDRPWLIRTDGTGLRAVHKRSMPMEISGHEFWNPDGKIVWYDLQTPKSQVFWLAGRVLASNDLIKYSISRDEWSVHYNVSPDGKLFCGDGGGPHSVAAPGNGQWLYLFTPKGDGQLQAEKLVDLRQHDYRLEPNATFTPDMKWIVFRSNMHGPSQVYAVETEKSE
jgi:oligogalacturonide lyase